MNFLDPNHLITSYGTLGIFAIIFAESGLFFGFFLPGDSLLVTAGLLAATHVSSKVHLNLAALLIGIPIAAILGDQVGYWFGDRAGPALFRRPESRFFRPEYLTRAHEFLEERGVSKRKFPERVEVVDALPRNPAGKVVKAELRDRFAAAAR